MSDYDTVYFYVEGSDLHEVAPLLRERFTEFLDQCRWPDSYVWLVDQVREDDPTLNPGDLPDWELGLNMKLPVPAAQRSVNWFDDVASIVDFLGRLTAETHRHFVVGAQFGVSGPGEDLCYTSDGIDIEELRLSLDDQATG